MRCLIGEINIICTDLECSLQFYCDVLGFELLEREGPAAHLVCDGVKFLLLAVADESRVPMPYCTGAEFSIDLVVDNLADAQQQCLAAGVTFVSEFDPSPQRFFIHDPDGLVLEIIQAASTDS